MTEAIGRTGDEALGELLTRGDPGAAAFVVPDDGQVLTYAQVAEGVDALARRLAGAGVSRGDKVAFSLPNGPDVILLLLAIAALGAAAAPLNPAYTETEFTFFLIDIAPRLFLIPAGRLPAAVAAATATGTTVVTVEPAASGPPALTASGSPAGSFEPGGPDDIAVILHTSGTTSRPKQVPLRQRNLMASAGTIARHYRLGPADVSFCVMPLFHIHGIVASSFAALRGGGTVVVPRRFTPHRFWPQAREHGATWLSAGPTLHTMILDRADDGGPPATLRFTRSCSSALSPALLARAEGVYQVPMLEAYGMTEASHQMTSNPLPPAARLPGSVGVATGTEIGIADSSGSFVPDGSTGEVVIRGPGVMSGYLDNPTATAEAFFGDWFRTGDLGSVSAGPAGAGSPGAGPAGVGSVGAGSAGDGSAGAGPAGDGYLTLLGRIKEMIIRGGENIAPAEIEQVLLSHPAVTEAVCFGVPDDKYGELVAAAVTLGADAEPRALIDHCRDRLAAFKVPVKVDVLTEIPRTPTGKIQRRRVAALITDRNPK